MRREWLPIVLVVALGSAIPGCHRAPGNAPVARTSVAASADRDAGRAPAPEAADRKRAAGAAAPVSETVAGASRSPQVAVPRIGEQLTYDISWSSFLTAGRATVTVRQGKVASGTAYDLQANGQSVGLVRALHPLAYTIETLADAATLLPLRVRLDINEDATHLTEHTIFDRPAGLARMEIRHGQSGTRRVKIPPGTLDPLAGIFWLARSPLARGARFTVPVLFRSTVYTVRLDVDSQETVTTPAGRVLAWKVTPTLLAPPGQKSPIGDMAVWISAGSRRLPIKAQVKIAVGAVDLVLRSTR